MTIDRVREVFGVSEFLQLPQGARVRVEIFAELFNEASENPTYEELVNLDAGKGYIPFFDDCKEKGILK